MRKLVRFMAHFHPDRHSNERRLNWRQNIGIENMTDAIGDRDGVESSKKLKVRSQDWRK